jgi:hypothetical protein
MRRGAEVMDVPAFHLPGDLPEPRPVAHRDGVTVLAPPLQPHHIDDICASLIGARRRLRDLPTARVVAAIDAAARGLLQQDAAERHTVLHALTAVTGYSSRMAALVLDRMARDWTTPALEAILAAEFGAVDAFDGFAALRTPHPEGIGPPPDSFTPAAAAGGRRWCRPLAPALGFHVFAGNVPGVGVTSLVRSLLVRSAVFGKSAAAEPVLAPAFARLLAEADEDVAACVAVTWWPGGDESLEAAVLRHAGIVVHYGGGDALASLRQRAPAGVPFVDHGPRVSFALVRGGALEGDAAAQLARDLAAAVATFDQQGCVSPQMLYVLGSAQQAHTLAADTAAALQSLAEELPRGRIEPAEAAAVRELRSSAEFRSIAGQDVELWAGDGMSWTVILDADPAFAGSCLNRTLVVKVIPSLDALVQLTRPVRHLLQTVGIAGFDDPGLVAMHLAEMGVSRITPISAMPWPPPTWHHDGRGPLNELVRWVDLELD